MAKSKPSVAPGAEVSRLNHFQTLRGHGTWRTSVMGASGGHGFDSPFQHQTLICCHNPILELLHS